MGRRVDPKPSAAPAKPRPKETRPNGGTPSSSSASKAFSEACMPPLSLGEAKVVHGFASRCRELREKATCAIRDASAAENTRKQALLEAIEQFQAEEAQRNLRFMQKVKSRVADFIQQEAARSEDALAVSRLHTNEQLAATFDGWEAHGNDLVKCLGSKLAAARRDLAAEQKEHQNQLLGKAKLEKENAALRLQNGELEDEIEAFKEAAGEHAQVCEQLQQSLDRIKELEEFVHTVAACEAQRKRREVEERHQTQVLERGLKKYSGVRMSGDPWSSHAT